MTDADDDLLDDDNELDEAIPPVEELDNAWQLANYGLTLMDEARRHRDALPYFQKALMLDDGQENRFDCHRALGECYEALGELAAAASHYEVAAQATALPVTVRVPLARVRFAQGDEAGALAVLREVGQLFAESAVARDGEAVAWAVLGLTRAGELCLQQGMPERALTLLYRVLAAPAPADARWPRVTRDTRYWLAVAWDRLGKKEVAIRHLEALLAQDDGDGDFADYGHYLALTYGEVGQRDKGVRAMERALARLRELGLDEEDDLVQQWQGELQALRSGRRR